MKAAANPVLYTQGGFTCVDNRSENAAQLIRVLDVFVIGPAMLYAAAAVPNPWVRLILASSGAGTMLYNARNFLLVRKAQQRGRLIYAY